MADHVSCTRPWSFATDNGPSRNRSSENGAHLAARRSDPRRHAGRGGPDRQASARQGSVTERRHHGRRVDRMAGLAREDVVRCAIYMRKSYTEGLEQPFISIDAQRAACSHYVASQAGEGWRELKSRYDDGGFSGGSLDRPAMTLLLAHVEAGAIDVVVVYKIDRLSRSLRDFARLLEAFESRGVTFVSVTQQFSTTSSMGRLTLNVLPSFAQFEREITSERTRDKFSALRLPARGAAARRRCRRGGRRPARLCALCPAEVGHVDPRSAQRGGPANPPRPAVQPELDPEDPRNRLYRGERTYLGQPIRGRISASSQNVSGPGPTRSRMRARPVAASGRRR